MMSYHLNNRDAVLAERQCGECACGPVVVKQTDKDFSSEEIKPIKSYVFHGKIAKGTFSTVYLAKNIRTTLTCAVKVYSKFNLKDPTEIDSINREKNILLLLMKERRQTAPFFVRLYDVFEDFDRLYVVQSWCPNGQLLHHLKKVGKFHIDLAKFYAAEILCALEHLHSLGIIHTALKTQNILLDETNHIKITSFGSAKYPGVWDKAEVKGKEKTSPGTLYYISPQALANESLKISPTSDLWALGCILYEMIAGVCPFQCKSEGMVFKNRFNLFFYYPVIFCPKVKDLVQQLLSPDPHQRLGANDIGIYTSIRCHPFFADINFEALYYQIPPQMYQQLPGTSLQGGISGGCKVTENPELPIRDGERVHSVNQRTLRKPPREGELGLASLTPKEVFNKSIWQRNTFPKWNSLCCNNVILKYGLSDTGEKLFRGKILFPQKRVIFLTLGPHLYLADPTAETIIEEIPWGPELHVKHKNKEIFLIQTMNRKYYFKDSQRRALSWCVAVEEVHKHVYNIFH